MDTKCSPNMDPHNLSYDQWLSFSEEERRRIHSFDWNTYERDGYLIAHTAAVRLAESCEMKVYNIQIGTYHGGEYLLHLTVSISDYSTCPAMLEQTFEGFRVVWFPQDSSESVEGSSLVGEWEADFGDYWFQFIKSSNGLDVVGKYNGRQCDLAILHPTMNESFLLFTSFEPVSGIQAQHTFRVSTDVRAEDSRTVSYSFNRLGEQDEAEKSSTRTATSDEEDIKVEDG